MLRISEHFHASDLGRQRQGNEDNLFVRAPLFVVADGMGGAQAGEVASEMAVESFDSGLPDGTPADGLVSVIEDANRRIHDRSRTEAQRAGMGTTVTAAYVGEQEVTIAHVGDSRAYVLREGELFMVCSDGLTSMVPEARVGEIIAAAGTLDEAGRELIAAANDAGGRDNITEILFRLEEVDGEPADHATGQRETSVTRSDGPARAQATATLSAVPEARPIEEPPPRT